MVDSRYSKNIMYKNLIFLWAICPAKKSFSSPMKFSTFATQFLEILFPTFESKGTESASLLLQCLNARSKSWSPWNKTPNLLKNKYTVPSPATAPKTLFAKWKSKENLPCSFGLTGRIHEEECDESFLVFCLMTKNCTFFFNGKENGKKEMIKREIAT